MCNLRMNTTLSRHSQTMSKEKPESAGVHLCSLLNQGTQNFPLRYLRLGKQYFHSPFRAIFVKWLCCFLCDFTFRIALFTVLKYHRVFVRTRRL